GLLQEFAERPQERVVIAPHGREDREEPPRPDIEGEILLAGMDASAARRAPFFRHRVSQLSVRAPMAPEPLQQVARSMDQGASGLMPPDTCDLLSEAKVQVPGALA